MYERPSVNDFGVIIPADQFPLKYTRDIIIQQKDDKLVRISESHPLVDALSYPLLFPSGELGWSPEMKFQVNQEGKNFKEQNSTNNDQSDEEQLDEDFEKAPKIKRKKATTKFVSEIGDEYDNLIKGDSCEIWRTITLSLFLNFILHIRKESFNLLFKGM